MAKKNDNSSKQALQSAVLEFFNTQNNIPYNYKQVSAAVNASTPAKRADVVEILEQMALDGTLTEVTPGQFKAKQRGAVSIGTFVRRTQFDACPKRRQGEGAHQRPAPWPRA